MGGQSSRWGAAAGGPLVTAGSGSPEPGLQDPAVSRVIVAPASPEALLFSLFLAAFASLLALLVGGFAPADVLQLDVPAVALVLVTLLLSLWFLHRDTGRVLVVLRRGFLLGSLEWALLLWRTRQSPEAGGLLAVFSSDVTLTLCVSCLLGWLLCVGLTRSPYGELGNDRS